MKSATTTTITTRHTPQITIFLTVQIGQGIIKIIQRSLISRDPKQ